MTPSKYDSLGKRNEEKYKWKVWQILFIICGLIPVIGIILGAVWLMFFFLSPVTEEDVFLHEDSSIKKIGKFLSSDLIKKS